MSQVVEHAREFPEADERPLEVTADVYRELTGAAAIRAVAQCRERPLEGIGGFAPPLRAAAGGACDQTTAFPAAGAGRLKASRSIYSVI
jgi:hypothetical protein